MDIFQSWALIVDFHMEKAMETRALLVGTKNNLFAVLNDSMLAGIQDFTGPISGHVSPAVNKNKVQHVQSSL